MRKVFAVLLSVAVLTWGAKALADRTVIFPSADTKVTEVLIHVAEDDTILVKICARVQLPDGGIVRHVASADPCEIFAPTGATLTTLQNFVTGAALTRWKNSRGL